MKFSEKVFFLKEDRFYESELGKHIIEGLTDEKKQRRIDGRGEKSCHPSS
jgi:hypothetical protein